MKPVPRRHNLLLVARGFFISTRYTTMLNIDTRILDDLSSDQFWLLCHILKRVDSELTCFPSNKKLCEDTGWEIKKLQKIKTELIDRGFLVVTPRKNGVAQTSNVYKVQTDLISVYVPAKKITVALETDTPPVLFPDTPLTPERDSKVLTNEVLTNEQASGVILFKDRTNRSQIIIEELNKIKATFGIRGETRWTKERGKMIEARIKEWKGEHPFNEIKSMIEHRCKVWKGTEWEKFIRIETLFQASKFFGYMEAAEAQPEKDWMERRSADESVLPNSGISW